MRVFKAALLLSALAAVAGADVKTYNVDKAHSEVGFQVRHMGVSKVSGRFAEFDGKVEGDLSKPEAAKVEFSISAKSITTDNERRDGHLRSADFFDTEKYPDITFKGEKIVAKGNDEYDVTGPFTMHGVTKTVTLPVKLTGKQASPRGDLVGFEVATKINRQDYGVSYSKTLDNGGLVVSNDVDIDINLEMHEARPAAAAGAPAPAAGSTAKEAAPAPAK